jgi:hypothetical protein
VTTRRIARIIPGTETSDGAGVRLRRSLGGQRGLYHDPFLMLDEFGTDKPEDYIAGFPPHPHRGFETVTIMLEGRMLHEDHMGNRGELGAGGVQWMSAGRGVIHSEMPQQTEGRLRGFQLWINLPAAEKMKPAAWRDIAAEDIPTVAFEDGNLRLVAGSVTLGGSTHTGAMHGISRAPLVADLSLAADGRLQLPVSPTANVVLYLYEGAANLSDEPLPLQGAALPGPGESLDLRAGGQGARLLLLAAEPIDEPVVQYGPFVMNSREEIEQALADYRTGTLTTA